jgi:hypothetical protein
MGKVGRWKTQEWITAQIQRLSAEKFPLVQKSAFYSIQDLTDWVKPTHIVEDNLLYLETTDLNLKLIKNHLPQNIWIRYLGTMDTHEVSHHTCLEPSVAVAGTLFAQSFV